MPDETIVPNVAPAPTIQAKAPEPVIEKPPATESVTLNLEVYNRLVQRLDEYDTQLAREAAKTREATERATERLIENGKVSDALKAIKETRDQDVQRAKDEAEAAGRRVSETFKAEQKRLIEERDRIVREKSETETRAKRYAMDSELMGALAGHDLVERAASDIAFVLRPLLTVEAQGESFVTRSTDGQTVKDYVSRWLEERPHYKKATIQRGGIPPTAAGLTPRHEGAPVAPEAPPTTMGMAALRDQMSRRSSDPVTATTNMRLGMGLKPLDR